MEKGDIFIFLEDENERDRLFIEAFLSREFNVHLPSDAYIKTKGWAGIKNEQIIRQLQFNNDNGGVNLIVFDADDSCSNRLKLINDHLSVIIDP